MKRLLALIWIATSTLAVAQNNTPTLTDASPAERSMAEAEKMIREKPAQYGSYNLLAMALVRLARENSDAGYFAQAEGAVQKSLQLAPNAFDTRKIQVDILLGEHEFPAALDAAKTLNQQVPDDVTVYGLLTDADTELGNYTDAEKAAQWMLNLQPGNLPALTHAARLRELFGDIEGAYELLEMAYQSTPSTENEERAWLLTQMGHVRLSAGNTDAAEKLLQQSLTAFPNYSLAVSNLAEVRMAQTRYEEAAVLFLQGYQSTPRARHLYDLAQALRLAGHAADAKKAFGDFEAKSLLESNKKDNSNRELVFYYADYAKDPAKALQTARREYAWRRDVYTLDAYAWALHVNGQDQEARRQIETALAVGIRDANLFRHAGEIALKLGDAAAAKSYLKQSTELNTVGRSDVTLAGFSKARQ